MKTTKTNSIQIEVPKTYLRDLKLCLDLNKPNFTFKYNFDYFVYIADKILHIKGFKKFENLNKVPISSIVLRFELGKHYKRYLEYLVKYKFIEIDDKYTVGKQGRMGKCKCFSLSKKYQYSHLIKYTITKKALLNKVNSWDQLQKKIQHDNIEKDDTLKGLYSMMKKITIDMDGVNSYLDNAVKTKKITRNKAKRELGKCERINKKEEGYNLFINKDSYGRIHSNFTNISKYIRENFLYIDGERLVHLDIITCQPALLYNLFNDYLIEVSDIIDNTETDEYYVSPNEFEYGVKNELSKYVTDINQFSGKGIFSNPFSPIINKQGFSTYSELLANATIDIEYYKNALEHDIYEFFRDKWDFYFGGDKTRSQIKTEFISYVFGRNNAKGHDMMNTIWNREFPVLHKMLKQFKDGNHRTLSHELQRKESNLMYNAVCPNVDVYGIDYLTVHDCLIVKESDLDTVYDTFENTLADQEIVTGVDY